MAEAEQAGESVRLDKWLWAVRLYKTRSMAIAACNNGRVRILGEPVKPSRSIRAGDVIEAGIEGVNRKVRVVGILVRRVAAARVPEFLQDLTPAEEYERAREIRSGGGFIPRPKGLGRPTKRDRRALEELP